MKAPPRRVTVGLTGGIACGKSEVARIWREQGIPVLDTDRVAHEVMAPGMPAYRAVVEAFGDDIVDEDGRIDRRLLGGQVFEAPSRLALLNRLVHPAVRQRWQAWREERQRAGEHAVVVIPLLFEAGADQGWDAVVCVSATRPKMMERLARRGLTGDAAAQRIAAQLPVAEKAKRSDVVIENNGTLDDLEQAATATWQEILAGAT